MINYFRSISLKTRIVLVVVVLFIAGIWGLAARVSMVMGRDLEKVLADQLSATVTRVGDDMNDDIELRLDALSRIAATIKPDIVNTPAMLQRHLEQMEVVRGTLNMNLMVVDSAGTIVADYPLTAERLGRSVKSRQYFRDAMTSGIPIIGSPIMGNFSKRPFVPIAVPLRNNLGVTAAVLVDRVILSDHLTFGQLTEVKVGQTGYFLLISPKDRLIISATDRSRTMTPLPAPGANPLFERRVSENFEGAGITVSAMGVEVLAASRNMARTGWIVVAAVPTKEIFAPIATLKRQIYLTALVISLLIVVILRFVLTREFARLEKAGQAIQRMTGGEEALAAIPVGWQDEIGKLIGNFNQLATERNRLDERLRGEITERKQAQRALDHAMARLQALSEGLTKSQEEERREIAYELHEQSAQELTALKIQLEMLEPHCVGKEAQERLRDALMITRLMQQRVRGMALGLHPLQLNDFGLYSAVRAHSEQLAEEAGWALHFDAPDAGERPDRSVELAGFRVAEEALTNVARHAEATEVWVDLRPSGDELHLSVRDNGVGFDADRILGRVDSGSLGLPAMEERIRQVGGHLEIKSSPGSGTEIHATFPARSWVFREFEDSSFKASIEKHISLHERDVPAPLKEAIYHCLREVTTDAFRHSNADRIKLHLINRGDRCEFSIANKRNGFNRPGVGSDGANSKGSRLQSMNDGVELAGGSEVTKSTAEQEVNVCVWWPSSAAKNGYPDVPGCPKLGVQRAAVVNGIEVRGCYCST